MRPAADAAVAHRRPATLLLALALLLTALVLPEVPAAAAPDETFADDFQSLSFSGSTGSVPWTGPWLETGESDGIGDGTIQVRNEPNCVEEPCLNLGRSAGPDARIEREADLSRFATATLTFSYKVHEHLPGAGTAALKVSDNGGSSWTTLDTWSLATSTGHQVATYDISNFIASDTRILFAVTGSTDESHMNIDNVEIAATGALCYLIGDSGSVHQLTSLNLADLDPLASEVTIGDTGADLRAIALHPATGELYAATADQLHTVDTATGAITTIGPFGSSASTVFNQVETLAFDPTTGALYASHYRAGEMDLIIQVDPVTGSAIPDSFGVGVDYVAFASNRAVQLSLLGLAFDATGQMWGMGWDDNSQEKLHTIDKSTGVANAVFNSRQVSGLSFDARGTLWALDPSGQVFEMGLSINSRDVNNLTNYRGLTCVPPAATNLAPVFDQDLLDRVDSEGVAVAFSATATDPDVGDTLSYAATGLPEGISVDPATGSISGVLGPNSEGSHTVTITVTDDGAPALRDTDTFTWEVIGGEVTYLVANSGGANLGDDLLTVVDRTDPNPATNEVNIGTGTGTTGIEAAALQPGTSVLFAAEGDQLGTIDLTTGVFTPKPSIAGAGNGSVGLVAFDNIEGMSFDPFTGELFATHRRGFNTEDLLFQLDPSTGAHVPGVFGGDDYVTIQNQGLYWHAADIAFDPTDRQLYVVHWSILNQWSIATMDPATGATVTIGPAPANLVSLAFDGAGRLYSSTENGLETLYELDKTNAAQISAITIDNASDYEALTISYAFEPNQAPAFTQDLLDRTDPEGTTISLAAAAADPDVGDHLTYSATGLPPGLNIDPGSGLITGTIGFAATGSYPVEIVVTDDGLPNLGDTDAFVWTVTEFNQAPAFDQNLLDRLDAEGTVISLSAGATDPDGADTLTYSAIGLPPGLTIDPASGLISGTIAYVAAATSPYAVTITVTDDGAPSESATPDTFTWTVSDINRAPTVANPGAQTTPELAPFSLVISASDNDGEIPSFSDGLTLPAWAVLTDNLNGTATIAGTPGAGDSGTTTVTITVSDGGVPDLSDSAVFDITVTNTNLPPAITNPGNQVGAEASPFSLVVSGSDPDGTTVSFSDGATLPAWATLTDNGDNTATITGTPGYDDAATTTVTITVSDGSLGANAVFDITITNTNRTPQIDPISDQAVAEGMALGPIVVTASDPDGTIPSLTATGLPGWAGFVDNGDGTAAITGTPGYDDAGTSIVSITAFDGALPAVASFDLIVTNANRAPIIDPVGSQSVAEGSAVTPIVVTATDPDGTFPSLAATGLPGWATFVDNRNGTGTITGTPGYDDAGVTTVTIEAEDGGVPNLADSMAFDLTVTDTNRSPIFSQDLLDRSDPEGATISLSAGATDPDLHQLSFSATGLPPGLTIQPFTGLISGMIAYTAAGIYPVEITATDDGIPSRNAVDTFEWIITNTNRPPVIAPIANQFGVESNPYSLIVTAADPDGTIPILTATGLPGWAGFVDNGDGTATVTGTPGFGDSGVSTVTITASDSLLTGDVTFELTVTDSNRPPSVDPISNQTVAEASPFALTFTATDPDGTIPTFSAAGLPAWAAFFDNGNGTGTITGTPGYTDAGASTVTITASDTTLTSDATFELTVIDINRPPVFAGDLTDRADAEGAAVSLSAAAVDPDFDNLTYAATGLPSGVTIDAASGEVSGTIAFGTAGNYDVAITVTDAGTPILGASDTFVWTVTDVNRPPVLGLIGDQIGPEETTISFTVAATDPDADDLIFSVAGAPAGAGIDPTTGFFSWTPGEAHGVGSYTLTVVVTDDGEPALTDSQVVTITVTEVNRGPSIAPIPDQSSIEGAAVFLPVAATDPDLPANTLTYSATGLPPGLTVDSSTGAVSGTIGSNAAGYYSVSVAVTDNATPPLLATTTFDWQVTSGNRPPALDAIAPHTVAEEITVSFTARATDPEADRITFSVTGAPPGAAIDRATGVFTWTPDETHGPGTYRMTVLATDDGTPALSASEEVAITVTETNRAPSITAIGDRSNDEGDTVSFSVIATDPDVPSNTLSYTAAGLPPGLGIEPDSGLISGLVGIDPSQPTPTYTVEVTVTDGGVPGLSASTSFTWKVTAAPEPDPNTAPVIDPLEDRYTDVGSAVSFAVSATDAEPLAYSARGLPQGAVIDRATGLISGIVGSDSVGTHAVAITVTDTGTPAMNSTASFSWTVTDGAAAENKEVLVAALDGFEEPESPVVEPQTSLPMRRSLVVMGSAAAATTESLRWPFGLLVALLVGFATVGRIGLYPLLWRGERHHGTISFYDPELEFGLIDADAGGEAIFVHAHAFPRRQRQNLQVGTGIRYRLLASDNRASAWGATTEDDHA